MDSRQLPDAELLAGPRGRRLCFELVRQPEEPTASWRQQPLWWHLMADQPGDLVGDLASAVAEVDLEALAGTQDPRVLLPALADAVQWARYWQEPDEVDAALQDVELAALLAPVAAAVLASPAAAWWTSPVVRKDQWQVRWILDGVSGEPPAAAAAEDRLIEWRRKTVAAEGRARRERPADPTARCSGDWWSTPALSGLVNTTATLPGTDRTPVGLVLVEDSPCVQQAEVRAVGIDSSARVYEVTGPADWAELVAAYALPVTSSRRHDWYRATGLHGEWVLPDWRAVAGDWDGVHVTVAGYLSTAGRPVPAGADGTARPATVLAGWDPGSTWWLSDVTTLERPVRWRTDPENLLDWAPDT